jgi:hypothetical protein
VYYWNQRGSLNYETRLVLAPDIAGGEDRSKEFTTEDKAAPMRFDLAPQAKPIQPLTQPFDGAAFVFVGTYANDPSYIQDVMKRYPGGELVQRRNEHWHTWDMRAYYLPRELFERYARQESVTFPPPQAQPPS